MKATGPIPFPLTLNNHSTSNNSSNKCIDSTKLSPKSTESQLNTGEKSEHEKAKGLSQRRLSWAVNEKSSIPTRKKMVQHETSAKATSEDEATDNLRDDLMLLMIGEEHLLKVKVQYLDERTALNLQRPVNFHEVEQYFQNKYGRLLNFYYTTSTRELMIQMRNQQDLDHIIQLHEHTGSKHRMRLILSQKREQSEQSSISAQPSMGIHSGIQESTLSETSSIWSLISSSSTKRTPGGTPLRMSRWAEEDNKNAFETPKPPGNWREGRCLGRGAFGHVFVCLNVDTGEQLVVKKIFLHANNRHQRSRVMATLENELNLLGTLRHPNIVQYFGVVASPDCVNIFMELMAGSLKDQISEYGALGESMTVHFGIQILNGLAYLHSKEIVHRDIKPANILRHTRAQVKIGDFGSAKFLQAMCSEQGVDIQGTPHYTAPEIIRDNRRFEPRSDVWSVGITLVEMLTTQTPWAGIDPAAVHLRIAFDECPPLSMLIGKTSQPLETAIGLMFRREPEERPNAGDFLKIPPFTREEKAGAELK